MRFSFKIFSLLAARAHFGQDRAFAWLDADMRCLKGFTAADLDVFMPHGDEIMSYLGRSHYPQPEPYSECGFLGFNPAHDQTSPYLERMESLYLTGEIFSISQWHDSWLWDHVRKEFESEGHGFKNLSGEMMKEDHPFINCGLGAFFDHLKGPQRKKAGRSFDSDYVKK